MMLNHHHRRVLLFACAITWESKQNDIGFGYVRLRVCRIRTYSSNNNKHKLLIYNHDVDHHIERDYS